MAIGSSELAKTPTRSHHDEENAWSEGRADNRAIKGVSLLCRGTVSASDLEPWSRRSVSRATKVIAGDGSSDGRLAVAWSIELARGCGT